MKNENVNVATDGRLLIGPKANDIYKQHNSYNLMMLQISNFYSTLQILFEMDATIPNTLLNSCSKQCIITLKS